MQKYALRGAGLLDELYPEGWAITVFKHFNGDPERIREIEGIATQNGLKPLSSEELKDIHRLTGADLRRMSFIDQDRSPIGILEGGAEKLLAALDEIVASKLGRRFDSGDLRRYGFHVMDTREEEILMMAWAREIVVRLQGFDSVF